MRFRKIALLLLMMFIGDVLAAQSISTSSKARHRKYKLYDLGTLGGANSFMNGGPPATMNNKGEVVAAAETAGSCPFFDEPVSPAIKWEHGEITNLGLLPGGCFSLPNAVNDWGVIVGSGDIGVIDPITGIPEIRADLRYGGRVFDLGTFGGNNSLANDVNDLGQVVGGAQNTEPDPWNFGDFFGLSTSSSWRGFVWQGGRMRELGTLGGPDSFAFIVNQHGQIAGFSFTNDMPDAITGFPPLHPFLWERGNMRDLGTLGGTFSYVSGLNNRGQVAGFSELDGNSNGHAFLWDRGLMTDLGTLGGDNSTTFWINDAGQVVGNADRPDGTHHGFVWSKGTMTDIGTIGSDPCSNGFYINARGQIAGTTSDCHGHVLHFFVWENGAFTDLGAQVLPGSGLASVEPTGINDAGEVIGNGKTVNGDLHAVVIQPVGDCDSACEAAMAANQAKAMVPNQVTTSGMTALFDSPTTPLERFSRQIRQRYRLRAQTALPPN